jgi:hypothetical protein
MSSADLPISLKVNPAIVQNLKSILEVPKGAETTYEQNIKWHLKMYNREKERKNILHQSFDSRLKFPLLMKENRCYINNFIIKKTKNVQSDIIREHQDAHAVI